MPVDRRSGIVLYTLHILYHILKFSWRFIICTLNDCLMRTFFVMSCSQRVPSPIKLTLVRATALMTSTDQARPGQAGLLQLSQRLQKKKKKLKHPAESMQRISEQRGVGSLLPLVYLSVCLFKSFRAAAYQPSAASFEEMPLSSRILPGSVRYDSLPFLTAVYQTEEVMERRQS